MWHGHPGRAHGRDARATKSARPAKNLGSNNTEATERSPQRSRRKKYKRYFFSVRSLGFSLCPLCLALRPRCHSERSEESRSELGRPNQKDQSEIPRFARNDSAFQSSRSCPSADGHPESMKMREAPWSAVAPATAFSRASNGGSFAAALQGASRVFAPVAGADIRLLMSARFAEANLT